MSRIGSNVPVQTTQQTQATESTGKLGKIKDFFVSLGNGMAKAARAVGNFFTETLPNAFKSLTTRTAQEGVAPTQTRDVPTTSETSTRPTIEGFRSGRLPQGLVIDGQGNVSGQTVLTHTSPNGRDWGGSIEDAFNDTANRFISTPETVTTSSGSQVQLANKAATDLPRMNVRLPNGFNTKQQSVGDISQQLRTFAGTDNATTVLSGAINQYMLRPMEVMPMPDGSPVTFRLPQNYLNRSDQNVITAYNFTDNTGTTQQLGRKPQQYAAAQFSVDTYPNGDFRVTVNWDMFVSGFRNQQGENEAPLGGNNNLMKLNYQTEWRISKTDADQGVLNFSMVTPPTVSYNGHLTE